MEKEGPATEKECRAWLKAKHGLGMNYAWWIAEQSLGKGDDGNPETYLRQAKEFVETMYSGPKEALLPIFEELLALGHSLGNDVKVCPCKTIVPLYRANTYSRRSSPLRALASTWDWRSRTPEFQSGSSIPVGWRKETASPTGSRSRQ